jgi:hypothetical protein
MVGAHIRFVIRECNCGMVLQCCGWKAPNAATNSKTRACNVLVIDTCLHGNDFLKGIDIVTEYLNRPTNLTQGGPTVHH